MKTKAILLTGALALVIIGCVLVAGCTSQQQTVIPDSYVGGWSFSYDKDGVVGTGIDVLNDDGTGFFCPGEQ